MDPLSRRLSRHQVSAAARQCGEVEEGLAGEEVVLDVVDGPFDARLVGGGAHARGVDDEPARLGVFEEHVVEAWRRVFGGRDTIDFMLSGMTTGKTPPKNPQAASKPRITSSVVWANVGQTNCGG